ncbi:sulfite oxidase [Fistulifera solaris]|uniref:sulfite oxidase n=1 Tax=Fistulifera solaris TaxID=1519565 RepID=A0A1Z5K5U4_FISSO|nr:sulfite oxidase [Fistulifera solaris]|eukprot:GAX21604.1 sulfite oxidase [Fistulifera solaris]
MWNQIRLKTRHVAILSRRINSRSVLTAPFASRSHENHNSFYFITVATAASTGIFLTSQTAKCDKGETEKLKNVTVSQVAKEDLDELDSSIDFDHLPIYSSGDVARNNGEDGRPIWMSYGGIVYDVTEFVANHPGGSEKIMTAAGSAVEPFWYLYRQHYASDLPMRLMEHLVVGKLDEKDQELIDEQVAELEKEDPYAREPRRHADLRIHSDTPMNAETPAKWLNEHYLTPNALFYIRHHHPVPILTEAQLHDFRLQLDMKECKGDENAPPLSLSLDELKSMPSTTVTVTLQCSGNRRSGFNEHQRTSGTAWGQGAISTATFKGVRLADLLERAGLGDPIEAEKNGMKHVVFESLDGMMASIGIEKACNPFGDVIVAYEMNGEPLPRDHGFPLRVIVPGYAAVRNVKWVNRISVSREEAQGPWQRGLNYKTLPPSVTDASKVNLDQMPSMTEVSLFSGITSIGPLRIPKDVKEGDTVRCSVKGWSWAGGGRNIVRVDVTGDGGETWSTAELLEGSQQPFGRAWAWTFWKCKDVPAIVVKDKESGKLKAQIASKAVDLAFNVQPESCKHTWNVRGLGNNSWYRIDIPIDSRKKRYSN